MQDDFEVEQGAGDAGGDGDQVALAVEDFDLAGAREFGEIDGASPADAGVKPRMPMIMAGPRMARLVVPWLFRVMGAPSRELRKLLLDGSDQTGLSLHALVIRHRAVRMADSESPRVPRVRGMRIKSDCAPDYWRVDVGRSEANDLRSACIADSSRHTASPKRTPPRKPRFRAERGIESRKRAEWKWTDKSSASRSVIVTPPRDIGFRT
jgi:hypothetical protein